MNDRTLSGDYKDKLIAELRESVERDIRDNVNLAINGAATARAQEEFYDSTPFLLTLLPLDPTASAANDALAKAALQSQMEKWPVPLLLLVARDARKEGQYALLWQCTLAGATSDVDAGYTGLDSVRVPGQQEALDCIAQIKAEASRAEAIWVQAVGRRSTGATRITRLNSAREMQAAYPRT